MRRLSLICIELGQTVDNNEFLLYYTKRKGKFYAKHNDNDDANDDAKP